MKLSDDQLRCVTGGSMPFEPWRTWPSSSNPYCAGAIATKAARGSFGRTAAGLAAGLAAGVTTLVKYGPRVRSAPAGLAVLGAFVLGGPAGGTAFGAGSEYGIGQYVKHHDPACTTAP
jgi:hypothetical protein